MCCILDMYYQVVQFHGFIATSVVCDDHQETFQLLGLIMVYMEHI